MLKKSFFVLIFVSALYACGSDNQGNENNKDAYRPELGVSIDVSQGKDGNTGDDVTVKDALETTDEGNGDLSYEINPKGLENGKACTKDDQCEYGICYASPNITHGGFKFCTKDCTRSNHEAVCSIDDKHGEVKYTCLRWGTFHPEEKISGFCAVTCKTLEDCKAVDPNYNVCKFPGTGVYNVCMYEKN